MKKRTASLVALLALAACLLSIPAQAAVPPTADPCYENLRTFYANIEIDDNGLATAYSFASCSTASNTVSLTVYLQKQTAPNTWTTVAYDSASDTKAVGKGVSRYVVSGYNYRAKGIVSVYTSSGTYVESAAINSGYKYY